MRKSLLVLTLIAFLFSGCKNEKNQPEQSEEENIETMTDEDSLEKDGDSVLIGDFIYSDGAAVINGKDFIYGIVIDSMAQVLAEKVEPVKEDPYDMVSVAIKGKIKPNPEEDGWDEVVEITKIINISKSKSNKETIEINSK